MAKPYRESHGDFLLCSWCSVKAGQKVFHHKSQFTKCAARADKYNSSCRAASKERNKKYKRKYIPKVPCEPAEKSKLGNCDRGTMEGFVKYYSNRLAMWAELSHGQPFCLSTARRVYHQIKTSSVDLSDIPDERIYGSKATTYRPAA